MADVWNYSFDALDPQPVKPRYTPAEAKAILAEYFAQSYVGDYPLKYTSGVELRTADCESTGIAEIGFVGRVLLNAYNALEYGEANGREDLAANARSIFDSYLRYGFTPGGLLREVVDFKRERETDVYSIRRQSEGVYALLNYLAYEKQAGPQPSRMGGPHPHPAGEISLAPEPRRQFPPQIPRQPDRRGRFGRQHPFSHAAADDGIHLF